MQTSVKQYAGEIQRTRGVPLHIRVGLNSGEVVVRSIGSDLHMDYTAVGQTTHLAARMEQMAMPGSILITTDVLHLAEGYVQVDPLGPVPIKGLTEPAEVYEVTGAGPVRTRLQASAARGLTRFVGRQSELDTLRQALEQAGSGHGQVVAVIGEPGVGKSRLFWEFTQSHRTQGWLRLDSGSVSYGKATPYLPVIDLLKAYCQIEARDDARRMREKLTGKLLTLDEALKPTLPALLGLLDVPVEDPAWQALDPLQRRQRTLEAVKRMLLRESQVQPLLLVFEDLHWIDAETQALLDSLVESLPSARLLLLVNYRPDYQHGWGSKTYYTQLRLDPLPPASADELLQTLVGDAPALQPLKQLLIARTEGNPFFLEESVQTLVESGVLVGERGAYRPAPQVGAARRGRPEVGNYRGLPLPIAIQVPATVQAVLAARIDRLAPEDKRLLQTASVLGTEVPFSLLHAIAELPDGALHVGLAHLQAAEFLYETRLFPELAYTFKHALTHEVVYNSLLQERRRTLHARIVEVLEGLYPDRLVEHIDRLAQHAFRGEAWEKAVRHCRQAGAKAAARSANREAASCFELALLALERLPAGRQRDEQAIDTRFDLRNALVALGVGEYGRILDCLRAAETLAQALGDQHRLGWVALYMSQYFAVTGDMDSAIAFGQRALALAQTLRDMGLQVMAPLFLGRTYYTLGDYRQATDLLTPNLALLTDELIRDRHSPTTPPAVHFRRLLALSLAELGAFSEGIAIAVEGVRLAEAVDHPLSLADAYYGISYIDLRQGRFHKAIPSLERALALCREWESLLLLHSVVSALSAAYALSGRVAEALSLLQQTEVQVTPISVGASISYVWMSEAYLRAGCHDEAMARARHGLELYRERKQRGAQAWMLCRLGELHSLRASPEIERAEDAYRQALTLADDLGMRPLQAHCHRGLGILYATLGQHDPARCELSTAIAMYRAMDMTFWLPQTETALAQVEKP
jgi:tetratricopeptide (TPR) repeat protein